jgi:hypothetical protein
MRQTEFYDNSKNGLQGSAAKGLFVIRVWELNEKIVYINAHSVPGRHYPELAFADVFGYLFRSFFKNASPEMCE